ncbi:MAG: class I tRNA ligase family protein [Bacteroidota bacterium]
MEYNFRKIEQEWQQKWKEDGVYKVNNDFSRPKFYVLDMFPYPSGAGLHVGHPLGYIASDIYARYKRLKGFNVLHPMGYDSFGLPTEQYALDTGQHPAITTQKNIATFRSQLDKIGFCFDWSREIRTSDPDYYKWTQWIFLQLYKSWYNPASNKAEPIGTLVAMFEISGSRQAGSLQQGLFTAAEWKAFDAARKQDVLMDYRLAFSSYGEVNWCEALGTVLANDEVINGLSERGGHPVIKKKMRQWYLRITAYADRLLEGLEKVDFSASLKEQQRNWIGKSQGAEISFALSPRIDSRDKTPYHAGLTVYTTRPDTIFGVDFMVIAPEHELVEKITTPDQEDAIQKYLDYVKSRSDRERMAEVKQVTGCFTGAYAINPFDGRKIPVWIAEYVLAGYGTGAIMAVPCGDQRDYEFARHFNIPITNIIGEHYDGSAANPTKDAVLHHSGFLNGMVMLDAIDVVITRLVEMGIGKRQINYKMRDAGFSRQRYWGEPFPMVWYNGEAYPLGENDLPLELPHVDKYGPGPQGEGPLANLKDWVTVPVPGQEEKTGTRETSTMPGYAGSSWYFLRYMDHLNEKAFCDRAASDYWGQVDVYVGGTEHAVGHLLYSRMWTKVLFDLGYIGYDEPYKRLVNQGMITGVSELVYRFHGPDKSPEGLVETGAGSLNRFPYPVRGKIGDTGFFSIGDKPCSIYFSADAVTDEQKKDMSLIHIPIKFVDNNHLDIAALVKEWQEAPAIFTNSNGYYKEGKWCDWDGNPIAEQIFKTVSHPEKMSKRYQNVVNPDDIVLKFGADTYRMYEMFLGPVEASKPWDTKGIEGVHRFLKKFWRLFYDELKGRVWNEGEPTAAEWKILHRTIRKIEDDTERFSFNTAVSSFMICVNELTEIKCYKKAVLEQLLILLTPYAPHIAEELWHQLGNAGTVLDAAYPVFDVQYVVESSKEYPVSINGKVRTSINIALDSSQPEVEQIVMANDIIQKWLEGKSPKKIIYVKNKMVNVVV